MYQSYHVYYDVSDFLYQRMLKLNVKPYTSDAVRVKMEYLVSWYSYRLSILVMFVQLTSG